MFSFQASEEVDDEDAPIKNVYCRNFPDDFDQMKFQEIFGQYGKIVRKFIATDRSYAIVEYENHGSCQIAITNLHNMPPLNLFVQLGRRNRVENKNNAVHQEQNRMESEENDIIYLDRFNNMIDVLVDENDEIYVPLSKVDGVKCVVKMDPQAGDEVINVDGDNYVLLPGNGSQNAQEITWEFKNKMQHNDRFYRPNSKNQNKFYDNKKPQIRGNDNKRYNFSNKNRNNFDGMNGMHDNKHKYNSDAPRKFLPDNSDNLKIKCKLDDQVSSSVINHSSKSNANKFNNFNQQAAKSKTTEEDWDSLKRPDQDKTPKTSPPRMKPKISPPKLSPKSDSPKSVSLQRNKYTEVKVETVVNEYVGWVQIAENADYISDAIEQNVFREVDSAPPIKPYVGLICVAKYEGIWLRAIVLKTEPKLRVRFIDYGNELDNPKDGLRRLSQELCNIPAQAIRIRLADGAPCKIVPRSFINVVPFQVEKDEVIVHVEHGIYENLTSTKVNSEKRKSDLSNSEEKKVNSLNSEEKKANSFSSEETKVDSSSTEQTKVPKLNINSPFYSIRKSLFEQAGVGCTGVFEAKSKFSNNVFVAAVLPNNLGSALLDLDHMSSNCSADSSFKPAIGDLAAAENNDCGWCRCVILDIKNNKYSVAFIDWGHTMETAEVRPVPPQYVSLPQFVCLCEVDETLVDTVRKEAENFKVLTSSNDKQTVELYAVGDKKLCNAVLYHWCPEEKITTSDTPKISTSIKPQPDLKNGDKVQLIHEHDGYLYVRTKACHDLVKKIDQLMNELSPSAPALSTKPNPHDLVAAIFEDLWYRAVVISVNNNNANVLYIDYGNEETVPLKFLRTLSVDMANMPHTLIKTQLQNFTNEKFSSKELEYLGALANKKAVLTTKFENLSDGVDFLYKDGRSVCDELTNLEKSTTSRSSSLMSIRNAISPKQSTPLSFKAVTPSTKKIMYSEILTRPLPINKNFEICILDSTYIRQGQILFCANDQSSIDEVYNDLTAKIDEYMTNVNPQEHYKPIIEEIVLSELNGQWARATVIEVIGDIFNLYFIDHGQILDAKEHKIRRIPEEFCKVIAIAELGQLKVLNNNPSPALVNRVVELFNNKHVYNAKVLEVHDQIHTVEIPTVTIVLKNEKLISE